MRLGNEKRERTALLLTHESSLLIDCGPDIRDQLCRHSVSRLDAVLITHEHGDHYLGMDELVSFKRTSPRGEFRPIPVFLTARSWKVIGAQFGYLEKMGVITVHEVKPSTAFRVKEFEVFPFKTSHGSFALGSVGYSIKVGHNPGNAAHLVYTSDFVDLPEHPTQIFNPDYLIIQSFWLNEPRINTPQHMSFQRAVEFIKLWKPIQRTFLVHIGDGDWIKGDPANKMSKKREPAQPMKPPQGGSHYPVPLNQEEWEGVVEEICADYGLPCKCTVAYDDLCVQL